MIEILIKCFLLSLLLHIIDDFVFQPICLSKLKQKSFWTNHEKYSHKYKDDYKMALVIHSLSWSIMISLPLIFILNNIFLFILLFFICLNTIVHYLTDNLKANKFKINLVFDQLIHFGQIVLMYLILFVILNVKNKYLLFYSI